MKLDVTLTELSIINCALDDYYGSMVDYYRTKANIMKLKRLSQLEIE